MESLMQQNHTIFDNAWNLLEDYKFNELEEYLK